MSVWLCAISYTNANNLDEAAPPIAAKRDTVLSEEQGEARISRPAKDVVVVRFLKHLSQPLAQKTTAQIDSIILGLEHDAVAGPCTFDILISAFEVSTFEPTVRTYLDDWTKKNRSRIRSQTVLLQPNSKVFTMMLAVANLVVGGHLQLKTDPRSFETAIRVAVAQSVKSKPAK